MFRLYYRLLMTGVITRGICALPKEAVQELCDVLNKECKNVYHWVETAEWFAQQGEIVKLPNEHLPPETWKLN